MWSGSERRATGKTAGNCGVAQQLRLPLFGAAYGRAETLRVDRLRRRIVQRLPHGAMDAIAHELSARPRRIYDENQGVGLYTVSNEDASLARLTRSERIDVLEPYLWEFGIQPVPLPLGIWNREASFA